MSVETPVAKPREWTEQDHQEQLKALFWFHEQIDAGKLEEFEGRYIAIKGQDIVDSDVDEKTLGRRIDETYGLDANILIKGLVPVPNWK